MGKVTLVSAGAQSGREGREAGVEVTNTRDVPRRAGHHGPACREMGACGEGGGQTLKTPGPPAVP